MNMVISGFGQLCWVPKPALDQAYSEGLDTSNFKWIIVTLLYKTDLKYNKLGRKKLSHAINRNKEHKETGKMAC